ncbi:amino acid ABC transporter permease [Variovorax sp. KBW07]|uniref:amino acid ABC transporter permease n=1 Tax=Variovorax sp. KBW07 TaxID=2153358 RepID=UPI000F58BE5C|nr:amino acid ABC transporter permease [Variovorax sp. KBW07]RQO47214.1 amino acid ABC transporter permease [Variovorax sp. KBW07]
MLREQLLAPHYLRWLLDGWLTTLWTSLLVAAGATALGVVIAAGRSSSSPALLRATGAYVSLFRNTPLLVQLFFWYFGAPSVLPEAVREWLYAGHVLSFEMLSALVGLTLYAAAYVGEDIRSGIRGVPAGQTLAALALGLTRAQVLAQVVLPQALRIALPPLLGQYMNIVKNTSLAMAVGLVELSYASRQVEAETFKTFQAFGFATLLYIVTIGAIEVLAAWAARRQASSMPVPGRAA